MVKKFVSGADRAKGMVLVTRTSPLEKVPKRTLGLSLFIVDLPNPAVEIVPIEKHGINYSESCAVYINDLRISTENLLGEG